MSSLTWLDHSERERRLVLDAIDRFAETETRDELGLGSIRDAFADLFFPGTSTIQTRARYFLFIPWMYRKLASKNLSKEVVADRARKEEIKLVNALLAADDNDGAFGKLVGAALKRLPSSIYWQGLGTWRIRRFQGSLEDYHRSFGRSTTLPTLRDDDGDSVEGRARQAWDSLPESPDGFPDSADFQLTWSEAGYLRDRIVFSSPRSLLAFLVRRAKTLSGDYPWEHPQYAEFPQEIRTALEHARLLAETTQGAAWLYNLLLAEELPDGDVKSARVEEYRSSIKEWCKELKARHGAVHAWSLGDLWMLVKQGGRVTTSTERFVEQWLRCGAWEDSKMAMDGPKPRALIRDREKQLKGGRARLGNPRAIELWGGNSGTARLSYRWNSAVRLLRDIEAGLKRGVEHA